MGARNQVGIGLSSRPASLRILATQFQTRFQESIPRPIAGLKFPTLEFLKSQGGQGTEEEKGYRTCPPEPEFLNIDGAQESISRNRFRQPM